MTCDRDEPVFGQRDVARALTGFELDVLDRLGKIEELLSVINMRLATRPPIDWSKNHARPA